VETPCGKEGLVGTENCRREIHRRAFKKDSDRDGKDTLIQITLQFPECRRVKICPWHLVALQSE
jgi:hypothetical protein